MGLLSSLKKISNDDYYGVKGVVKKFPKQETKGVATISNFEFKESENALYNMRQIMNGGGMFRVREGKYARLHVEGELMMTDTGMERESNKAFIRKATGRVLIAGLGIGMVLENILSKKDITEVVVIEKYQDVVDLVAPKFTHPKLKVITADIFTWRPVKGEKFDTIYFDIWPEISQDNLPEIKKLHNAFKNNVNRANPAAFMNSWMKEYLQRQRARDNRSAWRW